MGIWKFGNFEANVDFFDADFLDTLEEAKKEMNFQNSRVPKVGKNGDIIRARCNVVFRFFDTLFGEGTSELMFEGRNSLELCIRAMHSLSEFESLQGERFERDYSKYQVQSHGNRQQRRAYEKGSKKNYPRKQG